MRKSVLLFLFVTAVLFAIQYAFPQDSKPAEKPAAPAVSFSLKIAKQWVNTGNPVLVTFLYENPSDKKQTITLPKNLADELEIIDSLGKTVKKSEPAKETSAVTLEPFTAAGRILDITKTMDIFKTEGAYTMKWNHDGKATNSVSAGVVPNCKVSLMTNYGEIVIAFYPEDAPNTVINFVKLARSGFYTGLTFHRIIKGFMMQGGCPRGDGTGDAGYKLKAEFNSRKHTLGTLSMARSQSPDSAGSQFFICFADAPHLDGNYTAFGYVAKGIEVVKDIETKVKTGPGDKPLEPVKIEKVTIIE